MRIGSNWVLRVMEFIVHRQLLSHLQGPSVPWQITEACLQKEREKTQGTRLGRFVVSHLLLDECCIFYGPWKCFWSCETVAWNGQNALEMYIYSLRLVRDSFTVFFTRDGMEYQNRLRLFLEWMRIVDLHRREAVSRVIQYNLCISQHNTLSWLCAEMHSSSVFCF